MHELLTCGKEGLSIAEGSVVMSFSKVNVHELNTLKVRCVPTVLQTMTFLSENNANSSDSSNLHCSVRPKELSVNSHCISITL